ncbi:MAG: hypothetical protein ACR2N6_00625, partial [Miltoncostaeaceae bacterium]
MSSASIRSIRRRGRALALGLAAVGAGALAPAAVAADFTPYRFDDPVPDGCAANDCSLREAVIDANASGDLLDRVLLPPGTYTLSLVGDEDASLTGDLDLFSGGAIEVRGTGAAPADTVILAPPGERHLDVLGTLEGRVINLTLRGGEDTVGGAIRNDSELIVRRVVFDQNDAGDGGAIHSSEDDARVTIEDSTFTGNRATGSSGGAIHNESASTVVVARSSFTGNTALSRGGAVFNQNEGTVVVSDGRFEGNRAEGGGSRDGGALFT